MQANCVDSTAEPEAVFASEVKRLAADQLKPREQLTLEPYERDHAVVVGVYRYVHVGGLQVEKRSATLVSLLLSTFTSTLYGPFSQAVDSLVHVKLQVGRVDPLL